MDLGTLGGQLSSAVAINDKGHIVGMSETKSLEKHVFIWTDADGMVDIGLDGSYRVRSINDLDELILARKIGARMQPFLWSREAGVLAIHRFKDHHTEVVDINNSRHMVGRSWRIDYRRNHAIVWNRSHIEK